jgi:hypothetical protein
MMKVLRGIGVGILSFVLFIALSVFGLAFMLKSTALNPSFTGSEIDKLPLAIVIKDFTEAQIGNQLPPEIAFLKEPVYKTISDQETALKAELKSAVNSGYGFFLGKSQKLSIAISLVSLKAGLSDNLLKAYNANPPPQLAGLPQNQVKAYIDQFVTQIPSTLNLDESNISASNWQMIMEIRQDIGLFQTYYYLLIGLLVLLALLIILISWSVKNSTRSLGIDLLMYGILELAGVIIGRYYIPSILPSAIPAGYIPTSLQTWLTGILVDLIKPLQTFSICVLVAGAILIAVSFIYKRRAAEE